MAVTSPGAGRSMSGEIAYELKISALCESLHGRGVPLALCPSFRTPFHPT